VGFCVTQAGEERFFAPLDGGQVTIAFAGSMEDGLACRDGRERDADSPRLPGRYREPRRGDNRKL